MSRVVTAALCLLLAAPLCGQSPELRRLLSEAEDLGQRGDVDGAAKLLVDAGALCEREGGLDCGPYLDFATGYVYQEAADAATGGEEQRKNLLEKAIRAYQSSIAVRETVEAVENLALVQSAMGSNEAFIGSMERLIALNPDGATEYRVAIAQTAAEMGNFALAKENYQAAIAEDPTAYEPRRGLLSLHLSRDTRDATPAQRQSYAADMLKIADELMTTRFSDLAIDGYFRVIADTAGSVDSLALAALVGWVDAYATGNDEVAPLEELPADWRIPPVQQLHEVVATPRNGEAATWWRETDLRKQTLAALLLVLASPVAETDPEAAIAILESAEKIAPDPALYFRTGKQSEMAGREGPHFGIMAQLLRLYLQQRTVVDKRDSRFRTYVSRLGWRGVRTAWRGDFLTLQRYHATLGVFLDDAGDWDKKGALTNARYHLGRAVDLSTTRARLDRKVFQPLPDLHRRLAVGVEKQGDHREAALRYIDAASDYLDVDDLANARLCYDAGMRLGMPFTRRSTRLREAQVERALTVRESIAGPATQPPTYVNVLARPELSWVFDGSFPKVYFVARQRFKVLMRLARQADEVLGENSDDAMRLRLKAVSIARDLPAFGSIEDVEDLRLVGRRLSEYAQGRSLMLLAPHIAEGNREERSRTSHFEKVWSYGGGEATGGFDVAWEDELLIAAGVLEILLELPLDVRPAFLVESDDDVILTPRSPAYELRPTVKRIEKVDDVDDVRLSNQPAPIASGERRRPAG